MRSVKRDFFYLYKGYLALISIKNSKLFPKNTKTLRLRFFFLFCLSFLKSYFSLPKLLKTDSVLLSFLRSISAIGRNT
jgi:hypothetical protein